MQTPNLGYPTLTYSITHHTSLLDMPAASSRSPSPQPPPSPGGTVGFGESLGVAATSTYGSTYGHTLSVSNGQRSRSNSDATPSHITVDTTTPEQVELRDRVTAFVDGQLSPEDHAQEESNLKSMMEDNMAKAKVPEEHNTGVRLFLRKVFEHLEKRKGGGGRGGGGGRSGGGGGGGGGGVIIVPGSAGDNTHGRWFTHPNPKQGAASFAGTIVVYLILIVVGGPIFAGISYLTYLAICDLISKVVWSFDPENPHGLYNDIVALITRRREREAQEVDIELGNVPGLTVPQNAYWRG